MLASQIGNNSSPLAWVADIDLDYAGYSTVGLFVLARVVALAVWRFGHIEEKWSAGMTQVPPTTT